MSESNKERDFYIRLKAELEKSEQWPTQYLYKFIVPTDEEKIRVIEEIFDNQGAVIEKRTSATQKYTSLSIHVLMEDADAVIRKYKEVSVVEGVISL